MKLEEWEKDGDLLGPCEDGTAEECYTERVNKALGGNVDVAATLLRLASRYLSEGKPMPKPLTDYIATVLNDTACEGLVIASGSAHVAKRAREIVKSLHLNYSHTARHNREQEFEKKVDAYSAQQYMYNQITHKKVSKHAAAKHAAELFPNAVRSISNNENPEIDSRIKAYIALYDRSDAETYFSQLDEWFEMRLRDLDEEDY